MSVLHPTLLAAGLAAMALPILIHLLLRRRYTPIRWAAMRFVQVAQKQQRRRRRLEQILLLIARCILVALIAIAVAHPFFGNQNNSGQRTLILLIDNGLSTQAEGPSGAADLERLRERAREEIDRLTPASGDRVAVISMASPPTAAIATPTTDFNAAREAVDGISPADSAPDIVASFELAQASASLGDGNTSVVLVSDWRAGSVRTSGSRSSLPSVPADTVPPPSGRNGNEIPPAGTPVLDLSLTEPAVEDRPNLRILEVSIPRRTLLVDDTPAVRQAVVRIDRTGPLVAAVSGTVACEIRIAGEPESVPGRAAPFVINAGERETTVAIELPPTDRNPQSQQASAVARVSLIVPAGTDSIGTDSVRRTAVRLANGVTAGLVRSRGVRRDGTVIAPEAWIAAALRPSDSSPIRVREIPHGAVDPTSLIGLDLVVVARPDLLASGGWGHIANFVRLGGSLLLFAPAIDGAHAWIDEAALNFGNLAALGREPLVLATPEVVLPGEAAAGFGLLNAELGQLAGAVRISRVLPGSFPADRVVLRTEAGSPILTEAHNRLWLVSTAISPDWSDLAARPLFLPMLQEIARQSPTRDISLTGTAGRHLDTPPAVEMLYPAPRSPTGLRSTASADAPPRAGTFIARNAAGTDLGFVAVNAEIEAGDTAPVPRAQIEAAIGELIDSEFRWADAEQDGGRIGRLDLPGLGFVVFAAAAGLALIESFIAFTAGRRSASPSRRAAA